MNRVNGSFALVDGHHMAAMVFTSPNIKHRRIYVTIVDEFVSGTREDFWSFMVARNFTWLYDPSGRVLLPPEMNDGHFIQALLDSPYRSLAYFARKAGAFARTTIPLYERKKKKQCKWLFINLYSFFLVLM